MHLELHYHDGFAIFKKEHEGCLYEAGLECDTKEAHEFFEKIKKDEEVNLVWFRRGRTYS